MKEITDSDILAQLNAAEPVEVTDDDVLTQLNAGMSVEVTDTDILDALNEGDISQLESGLRGAGQGLTFGLGDEASAGLAAGAEMVADYFGDKKDGRSYMDAYETYRNIMRRKNAEAEEAHPGTYGTAEFAGGMAVPIPGAALTKGAQWVGKGLKGAGKGLGTVIGAGPKYLITKPVEKFLANPIAKKLTKEATDKITKIEKSIKNIKSGKLQVGGGKIDTRIIRELEEEVVDAKSTINNIRRLKKAAVGALPKSASDLFSQVVGHTILPVVGGPIVQKTKQVVVDLAKPAMASFLEKHGKFIAQASGRGAAGLASVISNKMSDDKDFKSDYEEAIAEQKAEQQE